MYPLLRSLSNTFHDSGLILHLLVTFHLYFINLQALYQFGLGDLFIATSFFFQRITEQKRPILDCFYNNEETGTSNILMHVCLVTKLDNFFQNRIKCDFKKHIVCLSYFSKVLCTLSIVDWTTRRSISRGNGLSSRNAEGKNRKSSNQAWCHRIGKRDRHVKKEVIEWNCEPRLKVF